MPYCCARECETPRLQEDASHSFGTFHDIQVAHSDMDFGQASVSRQTSLLFHVCSIIDLRSTQPRGSEMPRVGLYK